MNIEQLLNSEKFKRLVRTKWTFSFIMLAILFFIYYGYVFTIALNKQLVAQKVGQYTTVGILMGVLVVVGAWLLTVIYVIWANTKYDKIVDELKSELK
ncbi:DUF485 domain-containing protein [Deferribacter autotrophicus]|uniref:DUF485 domain-containing protein n=1 Tax=Deferribacter autotrophicus TaxID=500465 RepID=A0A5A8F2Z0_9BACT|nr:DUF485 domain-containing protein [Deferribacter autotrophicus]KAA0257767.1 DUF485 domain-containing protein [Deferribacter autotrophicus]